MILVALYGPFTLPTGDFLSAASPLAAARGGTSTSRDEPAEPAGGAAGVNGSANQYGWTALMIVASNGDVSRIRLLVKQGAKVDFRDDSGETALMLAARYGRSRAVKLLLSLAADCVKKWRS